MRTRLLVAALVTVALVACAGDDDGDDEDAATTSSTTPTTSTANVTLAAYEITYDVEDREPADGDAPITSARLLVQRPYRSRLTTFAGDEVVSDRAADFSVLAEADAAGEVRIVTPLPAPAPGDVRAELVFGDDEPDDTRRLAGRRCDVHALGDSLLDGTVVPADSGARPTEVCIDGDGLVLEEVVRVDGEVVRRWAATAVDVTPTIGDDAFALDGDVVPATEGGGSVQEVEPTSSPPGSFWVLEEPPAGFVHRGRYAVVPPQEARPDDPQTRARVVAGVVDVWTDEAGTGLLLVDQGGTLGRVPPFGTQPHSELVDVGEVGANGELIATPTGFEVRVLIPPGRYVRVAGTLPSAVLLELVRSLREVDGTSLVYVEG